MRILFVSVSLAILLQQPGDNKVDSRLQQVVATVRDASGNIVKGLRKEDFIVEDGGVTQTIVRFSDDPNVPISLGVLIDTTNSMHAMPGSTESGIAAGAGMARVLLHRLKPDDEIVLMTFGNDLRVRQSFTKDHERVEDALSAFQRLKGDGWLPDGSFGTMSVLKALAPALQQVRKSTYNKRALIVMTDAYFSGDVSKVASEIHKAEVPIFTVALRGVDFGPAVRYCSTACHQWETMPPSQLPGHERRLSYSVGGGGANTPLRPGDKSAPPPLSHSVDFRNQTQSFLDTLANESGGRSTMFEVDTRNTMQRVNSAVDDIVAELRGQYLLEYNPGTSTANREIRVRVVKPGYTVHMRREDQQLTRPLAFGPA